MSRESGPVAFTEEQRERLEVLLGAPALNSAALRLDALQAMLAALASGPDDALPDEWQAVALGADPDASPADAHPGAATELTALLDAFAAATWQQAREGTLAPMLQPLRRGRPDYRNWCSGFLTGVELSPTPWHEAADADDVDELLFPVILLADELTEAERASLTPAAWRRRVLEAEADLPATLARLRDYWAIVRMPQPTIRRDAAKPGRNDPCPCGSGQKHKRCCGR